MCREYAKLYVIFTITFDCVSIFFGEFRNYFFKITSMMVLKKSKIYRAVMRLFASPFLMVRMKCDLAKLRKGTTTERRFVDIDAMDLKVAYIRSDFWLRYQSSSGAMAHTIGVVDAFKKICSRITVYSICKISYLTGDTKQIEIQPKGCLRNISELQEIEYSHYLTKKMLTILSKDKPSCIYQRYGRNNYTGVLLAKKLNIPCIIEYNGSELWMADNWGGKIRYRKTTEEIELAVFNAADLIVGNAKALKDELIKRGIQSEKIVIIPNGVDPIKFNPSISGREIREKYGLAEDDIVVTFVGTFGPWHGADVLAQSIKKVVSKIQNVKFMFVGKGGGLAKVQQIIEDDEVLNFVTYTGAISQNIAPSYLAASDILVSPQIPNPDGSPFFGSPTKLFEYMASGKAIVASDLDQMGQILSDNDTALLTTPGNSDEIADCILRLANDEQLRQALGKNAREEVVKKYTWDIHVKKILEALSKESI